MKKNHHNKANAILILILFLISMLSACGESTSSSLDNNDRLDTQNQGTEQANGVSNSVDTNSSNEQPMEERPELIYKVSKEIHHNPDGSLKSWRERTYDSNANEISIRDCDADGTITYLSETDYDANNNEIKKTVYMDGTLSSLFEYTYDSNGNEISYKWTDYKNMEFSTWIEYTYDAEGNKISVRWKDINGTLTQWAEYTYDENGKELSETKYRPDGIVISKREYTHIYDANGNELRRNEYGADGTLTDWREYEYDVDGNVVCYRSGYGENLDSEDVWEHNGNMARHVFYVYGADLEKTIVSDDEYTYDSDGNEISHRSYDKDGQLERQSKYTYDEEGNRIISESYDSSGTLTGWTELEYQAFPASIE